MNTNTSAASILRAGAGERKDDTAIAIATNTSTASSSRLPLLPSAESTTTIPAAERVDPSRPSSIDPITETDDKKNDNDKDKSTVQISIAPFLSSKSALTIFKMTKLTLKEKEAQFRILLSKRLGVAEEEEENGDGDNDSEVSLTRSKSKIRKSASKGGGKGVGWANSTDTDDDDVHVDETRDHNFNEGSMQNVVSVSKGEITVPTNNEGSKVAESRRSEVGVEGAADDDSQCEVKMFSNEGSSVL
jgi:hypothetical protein